MPDSCRDLMQESTSSRPVVSSSSMSFCPSSHTGTGREKEITLDLVLSLDINKMQKQMKILALFLVQFYFSFAELQQSEENQPRLLQKDVCQQFGGQTYVH
ncbi:uncharacterized [Tachysurus ichikawai]